MPDASLATTSMPVLMSLSIVGAALLVGTLTDLKTREVPDFLNYGLILLGLAMNGLFSIVYLDISYILGSVLGLGVMFLIAALMFYTGQWGGGDSKMLMGLGAVIGIPLRLEAVFLLSFFINLLLVGAFYGLLWSVGLAIWRRKQFSKVARAFLSGKAQVRIRAALLVGMVVVLILAATAAFDERMTDFLVWLALLAGVMYYAWVFVRSVEKACMIVPLPVSRLTEGDWIAKDVVVKGKHICGPKDLGLEKKQLRQLRRLASQGKIRKVMVKQGIPFVPSFLLAFLVTLWLGNPLAALIGFL